MRFSQLMVGSVSAFALSLSAIAVAQEENNQQEPERENAVARVLQAVTVSATKAQDVENVQTIPVSVTAFNEDTLDAF